MSLFIPTAFRLLFTSKRYGTGVAFDFLSERCPDSRNPKLVVRDDSDRVGD